MKKLLLTGVLMTLLVGPAASVENGDEAKSDRYGCAWGRYIDNFKLVDDKTVILSQGPSRRYKVTLLNSCRDLRFEERIAVKSTGSCLGKGDSLIVRGPGGFKTRCFISDIVSLPKGWKYGDAEEESEESRPE